MTLRNVRASRRTTCRRSRTSTAIPGKALRVPLAELLGPSAAAQRIGPLFERLPPEAQEALVAAWRKCWWRLQGGRAARPGKRG